MKPLIISIVLLFTLSVLCFLMFKKIKQNCELFFSEMKIILNATEWKINIAENLLFNGYRGMIIYCTGHFKDRKVKIKYSSNRGNLKLIFIPKIIIKKIPRYKISKEYPKIYKNCVFDGNKVSLYTDIYTVFNYSDFTFDGNLSNKPISRYKFLNYKEKKLSHEKCVELLEDLTHACEIVETDYIKDKMN